MAAENRRQEPAEREFTGRRILLLRAQTPQRRVFAQSLSRLADRMGGRLQAAEETEKIRGDDLVFLFGMIRESGRLAYRELQSVLDGLKRLEQEPPKAAALLTGTEVYGKRYGTPRAVREEEMGYVSHLLSEDTGAFCMRTAEHMAARFAKEKGLPVKILRVFSFPETPGGEDGMERLAEQAVWGLLYGTDGEAYNLPWEPGAKKEETGERSALSPVPIRPDFGKWEQLREERRLS